MLRFTRDTARDALYLYFQILLYPVFRIIDWWRHRHAVYGPEVIPSDRIAIERKRRGW